VFERCHYRRPEAVSFWNPQSRSQLPYMPRYHFDVIGRTTIADRTGLLLPDDIHRHLNNNKTAKLRGEKAGEYLGPRALGASEGMAVAIPGF
jgi:hypothetical protein